MFKDEADIAEHVIRHMITQGVHHLIVADNLSTDGTRDTLHELACDLPLTVVDDPDPAYYQSEKMTRLAHQAGAMGADWVIPFDADEMWYSPHGPLSSVLTSDVASVQWAFALEHVPHVDDPADRNPLRRMVHRRLQPKPVMKVAFRYQPGVRVWQGNHDVDHQGGRARGLLEIREFQYRTFEQTVRKVRNGRAAYEATTLASTEGSHWRQMGAMSDDELEVWWKDYTSGPTILDPAPV